MKIIDTRKGNLPQNHIINDKDVTQLLGFRQELRAHFTSRKDAIMNLIDALASNTAAKSIAELSLNPIFDYQYASVYDAIDQFFTASDQKTTREERHHKEKQLMNLCLRYLHPPTCRNFWLLALDTTPAPRPYAHTLADRSVVYHPNPIGKNRPITIGHQYAALAYLPEHSPSSPPWAVPLSIRRVESGEKATLAQTQQLMDLLT
ncbi:MAG: transposase [Candidatus Poribacteria bacterium]